MTEFQNGVSLHHVGYVVRSIEKSADSFARSLAADWDGRIIHDPLQTALVSFFRPRQAGNPMIELVEPAGAESAVARFLERGGGFHHLCYEVDSLDRQLAWTRSNGDLIARQPMPAVAFNGRRIAWIYTKQRMLIEYLEREAAGA
jgi:methylmalonyl-CoA/ethylmalonyl-CoA epimerase